MLIALPKGRYIDISDKLLSAYNINRQDGLYHYSMQCGSENFYLLKSRDIARLVSEGVFDIGLCPDEWIKEASLSMTNNMNRIRPLTTQTFQSGGVRISILSKRGKCTEVRKIKKIATSFPNITRSYFSSMGKKCPDIVTVSGSVEAMAWGICDAVVDCVETGSTANRHRLEEIEILHDNLGLSFLRSAEHRNFDFIFENKNLQIA